jgi:hypothetical protein
VLPSKGNGQTFAFLESTDQCNSLEYKAYCKLIIPYLQHYGWNYVESIDDADLVVFFYYGIDDGETTPTSIPLFGQKGGGYSTTSGTVTIDTGVTAAYSGFSYTQPTYGQVGMIPYLATSFNREFHMSIIDFKKSSEKSLVKVYEGRVKSRGRSGEISLVLPYMIEVLFKDFPGTSGSSKRVEIRGSN